MRSTVTGAGDWRRDDIGCGRRLHPDEQHGRDARQPEIRRASRLFRADGGGSFGKMRSSFRALLACLLAAAGGFTVLAGEPARFTEPSRDLEALVSLVERRLALMPEVAAWKHARGIPVSDESRERDVLERWETSAGALGVDRAAARAFMAAQIAVARELQERLIAEWKVGRAVPPPARDLERVIRPELDRIGGEMLAAVVAVAADGAPVDASARASLIRDAFESRPRFRPEPAAGISGAVARLRRTAPSTIEGLRRTGVMRVGLTGDYAPFSEERGGELSGLDVELAREFAGALGLRAEFVRTSWPRLMEDLAVGRFDFAAGGVSVNPERRARADFGPVLLTDGKTPIARCADLARFSTLEGIDQPGVRVIVNPGGTNERFARENLRRASIRIFPDNRLIFAEILAGRADVMITDAVEVRLQMVRASGLCGTRPEPFTRSDKAWIFPPGAELTREAAAWLGPRLASGEIARRLHTAIAGGR